MYMKNRSLTPPLTQPKSKFTGKLYNDQHSRIHEVNCLQYAYQNENVLNITLKRTIFIGTMKKILFLMMKILFVKLSVIPDQN